MSEPVNFDVWSEHLDESDAGAVTAHTPFGALLMAIAWFADDSNADPFERDLLPFPGETWFVKSPSGVVHTFKQTQELREIFERVAA